ncbi:Gp15 family bacteriophage protein [Shouchella hunanensis]|uniref:Gp15 family bacteriophage protein n=2 Tax=Shouchella TaxID=2893057 RepID=A0ABY7WAF2_9BACI|nr:MULTISPECIES: Gp15 family bacteriophage protein [Shouchella]MED4127712.1 Gp15 family bacteriophage protein [Shouchella miscanthi]WDF05885.1 Gp15 family bacteriophage protein [Shouchella hunanensis]
MWGWAALEADFYRFYRIHLTQEGFENRLSWRRFLVFVRGLPEDSAFQRFLQDKKNRSMAEWDQDKMNEESKKWKGGI